MIILFVFSRKLLFSALNFNYIFTNTRGDFMKIEKIDDNKIKVILTLKDLKERNIDLTSLSYNSPQTQKLFMDMMLLAESEHGFLIGDSQIFIEAVPIPPEGFEIIVSKVDDDKEFESIHKYIKSKLKKSDLYSKKKAKNLSVNVFIYCFSSFDNLCQGVKLISSDYVGESVVYKYKNYYYLVFSKNYKINPDFQSIEMSLNEFGEKVSNSAFFEGFLDEHSEKLIAENAIGIIKEYF